ncbi:MAG: C39 family peptidase [Agathobaculum desmolans]|uniref:C39 family peptidase n=1 Tax=Agathobaculum desmolans TaxID=39484 RepID=UPI003993FA53
MRIAQAAWTGGVHGAAAAAAAQAAPVLLKTALALILLFLCLPLLLLTAVPCNLFGAPSVDSADIQEMTAQAKALTAAWKQQRTLEQKAVDLFISLLPDDLDFIRIEKQLGNTNDYWMVAITSVHSAQDVMTINEAKIIRTMQAKLKYTLRAEYDAEGNFIGYVLVISDMTPTELMDKLGMDEQQRMWTEIIYTTVCDTEYSTPNGSADNTADMDFSDIVFTGRGNAKDVVYFSQYDSRWGGLMYGKTNTIAGAGCGPTSLAICVSTLTNKTVLPPEICDWSVRTGHRCEGSGSYHSLIPDGAAHYNVPCRGIGRSKAALVKALQDGKLVIAIMSAGHFTRGGHFIVLRSITDDGRILVADCASYERSQKAWDLGVFLAECNKGAAAGGPFWVLG